MTCADGVREARQPDRTEDRCDMQTEICSREIVELLQCDAAAESGDLRGRTYNSDEVKGDLLKLRYIGSVHGTCLYSLLDTNNLYKMN